MDEDEVSIGAAKLSAWVASFSDPAASGSLAKVVALASGSPDLVALASAEDPGEAKGKALLAQIKAVPGNSLAAQLADAIVEVGGYKALYDHWASAKKTMAKMPALPPSSIAKIAVPSSVKAAHKAGGPSVPDLPGKPGKGSKYVRTEEGAEYYGQPIGTLITADMAEKAKAGKKQPSPTPANATGGAPILVQGKKAGVLPPGAVLYLPKAGEPDSVSAKFVRTADGKWFSVHGGGVSEFGPGMSKSLENAVAVGSLKQESVGTPAETPVSPVTPPKTPGASPGTSPAPAKPQTPLQKVTTAPAPEASPKPQGKVTVGGVGVTGPQLAQAVSVLEGAGGMMVKQPLAKVANPLAQMDYHAVAKAALDGGFTPQGKFPTKQAVVHELKKQLAALQGGKDAPSTGKPPVDWKKAATEVFAAEKAKGGQGTPYTAALKIVKDGGVPHSQAQAEVSKIAIAWDAQGKKQTPAPETPDAKLFLFEAGASVAWEAEKAKPLGVGKPFTAALDAAKKAGATTEQAEAAVKKVAQDWNAAKKDQPAPKLPPAPNPPSVPKKVQADTPAATTGGSVQVPQAGGGKLTVTQEELADAVGILSSAGGMMIKQPLAKAGHKMQTVDYHAVAKMATDAGFVPTGKFKAKEAFLHQLKQWQKAAPDPDALDKQVADFKAEQGDKPAPTTPVVGPQSPAPAPKPSVPAPAPAEVDWKAWEGKTIPSGKGKITLGKYQEPVGPTLKALPPGTALYDIEEENGWALVRVVDGNPVHVADLETKGPKWVATDPLGKNLGSASTLSPLIKESVDWPTPAPAKPAAKPQVVQGPGKPGYELPDSWSMSDRVKAGLPASLGSPPFGKAFFTGGDGVEVWAFGAPTSGHTHAILVKEPHGPYGTWSHFGWADNTEITTKDGKKVPAGSTWSAKAQAVHQEFTSSASAQDPATPDPVALKALVDSLTDTLGAGTPQAEALGKVVSGPVQHPHDPSQWSKAERMLHHLPPGLGAKTSQVDHGDSVVVVFTGNSDSTRHFLARRKTGAPAWVQVGSAYKNSQGGWEFTGTVTGDKGGITFEEALAEAVAALDVQPEGEPKGWSSPAVRVYAHRNGIPFGPGISALDVKEKVQAHWTVSKTPKAASVPSADTAAKLKLLAPAQWTEEERSDAGLPGDLGKPGSFHDKGTARLTVFGSGTWREVLARRKTGNPAWVKAGRIFVQGDQFGAYPADAGVPNFFDSEDKALAFLSVRHDEDMEVYKDLKASPDAWNAVKLRRYIHVNGVDISPWADMDQMRAAVKAHQAGPGAAPSGDPWEWTPEQQTDAGFPTMTGAPAAVLPSSVGSDYALVPTTEGTYTHVLLRKVDDGWKVWGFRSDSPDSVHHKVWSTPDGTTVGSFSTASAGVAKLNGAHAQAGTDGIAWVPAAVVAVKAPEIPAGTFFVMPDPKIADQTKLKLVVGADGEGVLSHDGKGTSTPLPFGAVKVLLESGTTVDSTGTTVSAHGVVPGEVYFLGKGPFPAAKMAEVKHAYQTQGHLPDFKTKASLEKILGTEVDGEMLIDLAKAQGQPVSAAGVVKAVLAKIEALVDPVEFAEASKPGKKSGPTPPATPKPPPLTGAGAAIFKIDAQGFAAPFSGQLGVPAYDDQKTARIKAISAEFGGGKIVGRGFSKMSSFDKAQWIIAWHRGDMAACFALEKVAKPSPLHPGHPANKGTHKVVWAPAVAGEVPSGLVPAGEWSEPGIVPTKAEVGNYLIAANMAHPTFLTPSQQKQWVEAHKAGRKNAVDKLSLYAQALAQNGTAPVGPVPSWTPGAVVGVPWGSMVEDGTAPEMWPIGVLGAYLGAHGLPKGSYGGYADVQTVKDHLAGKPVSATAAPGGTTSVPGPSPVAVPKPVVSKTLNGPEGTGLDLVEDNSPPKLKGTHHVGKLKDQMGNIWVSKTPVSKQGYLVDSEHNAHLIAQAMGFPTAKSHVWVKGGVKTQLQRMHPIDKVLGDIDVDAVAQLKVSQLADIAREHLLDWVLDNDDSHGLNMVLTTSGRIVGIDKGRSFIGYGHWDGLDLTGGIDSRSHTIVNKLYTAIKAKKIDKATADKLYLAVTAKAQQMAGKPDSVIADRLKAALADRPASSIPGGVESQVAKAVARKNALVADFDKLWAQVYSQAGLGDLPPKPVYKIPANGQNHTVHTGFDSPGLVADVAKSASMGLSTFFKGTHLEDANILLWNERAASGDMLLRGEARVRASAREAVNTWLKERAVSTVGESVESKFFAPPKGFDSHYEVILKAAKHVSYNSATKDYDSTTYLDPMEEVGKQLQAKLDELTPVLASGDQDQIDALSLAHGDVHATVAAAKLYLSLIDKINDLKETGGKTQPGDIPKFIYTPRAKPASLLPSDVPDAPPVKVELVSASRASGQLGEDNILQQDGSTFTSGNPGQMYLVTLPTGEQIEFRHSEKGVPLASHGLLRFTVSAGDEDGDPTASLARIRAQLEEMGLPLEEADEDDMELFYWRHLAGVMAERNDSRPKLLGGKPLAAYDTFWSVLQGKAIAAGSKMPTVAVNYNGSGDHFQYDLTHLSTLFPDPKQELEVWRSSFAALSTKSKIQEFIDGKGYLPSFSHQNLDNPEAATGRPYWERFDVSDEEWKSSQMLASGLSNHAHALNIVKSGGAYSTEARIRLLGFFQEGMSSSDDQAYGSSQQVYTRQNKENDDSGYQLWYSPRAIRRTSTYSYNNDLYGKLSAKHSNAPFSFEKIKSQKEGNNETNVKESISLLDDIEIVVFVDESLREKAIDFLKSKGITEIRGVAVEDRLIGAGKPAFKAAREKVKAAW